MRPESIRQTEIAECGLASLAIVSGLLGASVELSELRRKFHVSSRGLTLRELTNIAAAMGMTSRPLRLEPNELTEVTTPAILHWSMNHYVVLRRVTRKGIQIHDPAHGPRLVPWPEVEKKFTGVAMEIARSPTFRKRKERSPLQITSLFKLNKAVTGGLLQVFVLSLFLQAYIVASPFYMQLAIDEAALKGDRGLLFGLAIGFGLFALFNVGANALREIALQKTSAMLGWDMTGRLFHHLLRLPLPWFQSRRLADALSRFDSITPIRMLISNGLVSSIIDGLLALVTLAMMLLFSWKLAAIVAASFLIYVAIRLVAVPATIQLAGDALVADIAEQGKRIETLRAIQTIKVMGAENQRQGDWSNRFAETIRTGQANAFAQIGFSSLQGLSDGIATVLIVYMGATAVIEGQMTVGVLFAFMAYKTQFTTRAQGIFETLVEWRMMDLHSDRVADIALTPVEVGLDDAGVGLLEMEGGVELRNLAFRYSAQDPVLFQNVSVKIAPGEFVAIVGPSGAGKSTLVKVLCGLYPASAGEVRIDDLPIATWGPRSIRQNLGVVLQDDELIAGSISENVTFFAENPDMEKMWECLALASIDEEVRAMPMRAETFVGDMGGALSGGQKQRILLARALYRDPKILVLDEATSHLDVSRERTINEALMSLSATRIVVAHRPETIAAADRVLVLHGGSLVESNHQRPPTDQQHS